MGGTVSAQSRPRQGSQLGSALASLKHDAASVLSLVRTPGKVYPVCGDGCFGIEQEPHPHLQTSRDLVGLRRQRPVQVRTPDGVTALPSAEKGRFGLIWVHVNGTNPTFPPSKQARAAAKQPPTWVTRIYFPIITLSLNTRRNHS